MKSINTEKAEEMFSEPRYQVNRYEDEQNKSNKNSQGKGNKTNMSNQNNQNNAYEKKNSTEEIMKMSRDFLDKILFEKNNEENEEGLQGSGNFYI